jgi:hypothetical protein
VTAWLRRKPDINTFRIYGAANSEGERELDEDWEELYDDEAKLVMPAICFVII